MFQNDALDHNTLRPVTIAGNSGMVLPGGDGSGLEVPRDRSFIKAALCCRQCKQDRGIPSHTLPRVRVGADFQQLDIESRHS
jgi:hypothetical protein